MADKGIIFSAPMVRALLGGRKTQTRRLLKPQPPEHVTGAGVIARSTEGVTDEWSWLSGDQRDIDDVAFEGDFKTGFRPGDRLYVRENHRFDVAYDKLKGREVDARAFVWCEADGSSVGGGVLGKLRPSIFMPRWASRLTLLVTDVRVQRLQEISEADAVAEGIERHTVECSDGVSREMWFGVPFAGYEMREGAARQAYFDLWDSLHNPRGLCAEDAPSSADANPWVVAVTFTVHHGNIDTIPPGSRAATQDSRPVRT